MGAVALSDNTIAHPVVSAFGELSGEAFALWIRLHTTPRDQLTQGYSALARHLERERTSLRRYLIELRRKGYVRLQRRRDGRSTKTEIMLTRRALLPSVSEFVRL